MSTRRDLQRSRKVYSYARPVPRFEASLEDVINAIDWKQSVRLASATGENISDLTAVPLTLDGVSVSVGERVLLKDQTNAAENGIYIFGSGGLDRAPDAEQDTLSSGAACFVEKGSTNSATMWYLATNDPINVGSTNQVWLQFYPGGMGGGGGGSYFYSITNGTIYTTGSVAIRGGEAAITRANNKGSDVFFYVSGSRDSKANSSVGTSVFGGDVFVSGSTYIDANLLEMTGTISVKGGITGSLTKLSDGTSYLIAGSNVTITSGANGSVTITSTGGGGGGGGDSYFVSTTNDSIYTTGSVLLRGQSSEDSSYDFGSNVYFYVSGSISGSQALGEDFRSVFGGDVVVSGSVSQGMGIANGYMSHAEGGYIYEGDPPENVPTRTQGNYSHAEGMMTLTGTEGEGSHAEGWNTITHASSSHAEGYQTETTVGAKYSHAEGGGTKTLSWSSHAEGLEAKSGGYVYSVSEITDPFAITISSTHGDVSSEFQDLYWGIGVLIIRGTTPERSYEIDYTGASWDGTNTYVTFSTISGEEPYPFTPDGINSFVFVRTRDKLIYDYPNKNALMQGYNSHAEGYRSTSLGDSSHAEGNNVISIGHYSHAEGELSVACGESSHAEGKSTRSDGIYSHAEGEATLALGRASHAAGQGAVALGEGSYAGGISTIASGNYQTVVGSRNETGNDNALFVIGDGYYPNRHDLVNARTGQFEITGTLINIGRAEITGTLATLGNTEITGTLRATSGISGSLTQLVDGTSYLVAGANVTITSASNGSVIISSAGSGGTLPGGTTNQIQYNDGAGNFAGASATWVAGTQTLNTVNVNATAVTASYLTGSLTKLSNGTSYLIAGNSIDIVTGSNGAVTISLNSALANSVVTGTFNDVSSRMATTASVSFAGTKGFNYFPNSVGSDVYFFVSGTIASPTTNAKVSVFGGDVYVSGTINANSISTVVGNWTVTTGSVTLPYNFITGNYTAGSDYYLKCSGTFTLSLPTAVGIPGRTYVVKNFNSGTITIDPFSTQTIDGAATLSFSTQYTSYTLVSDGANWMIV